MINASLTISQQDQLHLVAWSQGNTQTLIAGADAKVGPYLRSKVKLWVALSPVSFLYDSSSTLLTIVSRFHLADLLENFFPYGVLQGGPALSMLETFLCKVTLGELCKLSVDLICGISKADSKLSLERLTAHFPAGCSVKDVDHYQQFIDSPLFARFNYGQTGNEHEYNRTTPPSYNLTNFKDNFSKSKSKRGGIDLLTKETMKVALFAAGNDDLVSAKDLQRLLAEFPPEMIYANNLYEGFSHVTWMVGDSNSFTKWGKDVLELLANF